MPSKNIVKTYVENGYYHIYNRGIEKRKIFLDNQDCEVFLHYLRMYLSPIEELKSQSLFNTQLSRFIPLSLSIEIDLMAFALMPNHIHLLVKQNTKDGIIKFMRRLATSYVMYFNKKYKRVGSLFQNRYKAALIDSDLYLLHLSRYIHLNPIKLNTGDINFKDFSSYSYYINQKQASWMKPNEILDYFQITNGINKNNSYQAFIEEYNESSAHIVDGLTLEDEKT